MSGKTGFFLNSFAANAHQSGCRSSLESVGGQNKIKCGSSFICCMCVLDMPPESHILYLCTRHAP